MNIADYEKAVLSVILKNSTNDIPYMICSELDDDKFSSEDHKLIYRSIQSCVLEKKAPSVANVTLKLGDEKVPTEYLLLLHKYLDVLKSDSNGWESWVQLIDNAGRLRHLGLIIDDYSKMYEDFENLVQSIDNVDEFIGNFFSKVNKGLNQVKTTYRPIKSAIDEEKRRLELEKDGFVVDIIPCGIPCLENYFIPRPATLGVIAGISSMGKTQLAIQIACGVAIQLKKLNLEGAVCINEFETAGKNIVRRLACSLAGIDSRDIAGGKLSGKQYGEYCQVLEFIEDLPIYYDDTSRMTSTQMAWQAIALNLKVKRIFAVSDYLELFSDEGNSEELRVSQAVRNIRHIAWETGSCECVISQFNNSVMMTDTKIGGMFKTRYSGAISQAADWFLEVYNPIEMTKKAIEYVLPDGYRSDMAYILVEKNKEYSTGKIELEWMSRFTRFRDIDLPTGQMYRIPE